MPVDARVGLQAIGDVQSHFFTFAKTDKRRRQRSIHTDRVPHLSTEVYGEFADIEVKLVARQRGDAGIAVCRAARPGRKQAGTANCSAGAKCGAQK